MDSKRYERIVRTAQGKFPIDLKDDFIKNLAKIETEDKIYYARKINDILKEVKDRYWVTLSGKIWSDYIERFMTLQENRNGYIQCNLVLKEDNKKLRPTVHRLVNILFNYNEEYDVLQTNHLDGDKNNNHVDNLEWCTAKENINHALNIGLRDRYLDINAIEKICEEYERGETVFQVSKKYPEIPYKILEGIKHRDIYRPISKDYEFKDTLPFRAINLDQFNEIYEYFKKVLNENNLMDSQEVSDKYDISLATLFKVKDYLINNDLIDDSINIILRKKYMDNLLPDDVVHYICEELENGERDTHIISKVGNEYKIKLSYERIKELKKGNTYKYITDEYNLNIDSHPCIDLYIETVNNICDDLDKKYTGESNKNFKDISNKYNISDDQLRNIRKWHDNN